MFTGLIQQTGRLEQIALQGAAGRLILSARFETPVAIGESIAVNGACLTLVECPGDTLAFDMLKETLDRTALRAKSPGSRLNLERALRLGDPLGGHLVSGHVDGVGRLASIGIAGRDKVLAIAAPALISEIVAKGSIAIDGVSLTVVDVRPSAGIFTVHVIPHTWEHTALSALAVGAPVNLETDLLGKYARAAQGGAAAGRVTWDRLHAAGFAP